MPMFTGTRNALLTPKVVGIPTTLPNITSATLALWLDANNAASITSSGGLVSAWADQSASVAVFSQGTGSAQPSVVTNVYNGLPTIRFDGARYLVAAALIAGLDQTAGFTILCVCARASGTTARILGNGTGVNSGWSLATSSSGPNWELRTGYTTSVAVLGDGSCGTTLKMVIGVEDSAGSGTYLPAGKYQGIYVDSSTAATTGTQSAYTVNSTALTHPVVGGNASSLGANLFTGDICEMIGYNGPITASEVGLLRTYCQNKWGTT